MTEKQIKERIIEIRRVRRKTWLTEEIYTCSGCGTSFRYKTNLSKHQKNCLDYKHGKPKS